MCPSSLPPSVSPGYIVFSGPRRANGVQGLRFIIQSEKAPHYLESRVEAFLCTMERAVEEMSEEAFQKHIQALAIRRLDKPKKLSAECAKYWGEIISQQYNFDRGEASSPRRVLLIMLGFHRPKCILLKHTGIYLETLRPAIINSLCCAESRIRVLESYQYFGRPQR